MRITSRKTGFAGLALVGASALVLSGCAPAPEEDEGGAGEAAPDFLPCMVSDAGGFDDRSFNQLGFEGMEAAAEELGTEYTEVQSDTESDYGPNLTNLVAEGCDVIVTVGFALAEAAGASAAENPDIEYISIDDTVDLDFNGETDYPNIKPIVFDTAQAAFLAGYAAASYSETKVVGTFGGMNFPTVSIFMDGFRQGVEYFNEQNDDSVTVLGWDGTDGLFTGGFEANDTARQVAQSLIDQNVDVLLPVGGPIYQSAAAAIRDSGRPIAMLGVDADVFETDPTVGDLLLTSIRKGIDVGVEEAIIEAGQGEFDPTPFVGTLENGGVGLAPFHEFEDEVDPELQAELDEIEAGIIDGSIEVQSYLAG